MSLDRSSLPPATILFMDQHGRKQWEAVARPAMARNDPVDVVLAVEVDKRKAVGAWANARATFTSASGLRRAEPSPPPAG